MENRRSESPGIRKAAILVASLDPATADKTLETLSSDQAQRVRQAVADLGPIDPKEQRRVIDEFFRVGSMVPRQSPPGIELDARLPRKLSQPQARSAPGEPRSSRETDHRPFCFLHEAQGDRLAGILTGERPQTIALVLSHLPPERAGYVLAQLRGPLQAEVIRRLVELEETDPEILREVERALESRLSQQVHMRRRRVAGLKAASGILEACDGRIGVHILDNLAKHDQPLARRLGPPSLDFDDLAGWDDATLTTVFQAVEPDLAMTALVGAPPEMIDRALRHLPPSEAATVRHKLDHPGPIRLRDVEDARQQIADRARGLAMQGHIRLPSRPSLTVS
jgi:flagellar motor switch protein FliG